MQTRSYHEIGMFAAQLFRMNGNNVPVEALPAEQSLLQWLAGVWCCCCCVDCDGSDGSETPQVS